MMQRRKKSSNAMVCECCSLFVIIIDDTVIVYVYVCVCVCIHTILYPGFQGKSGLSNQLTVKIQYIITVKMQYNENSN